MAAVPLHGRALRVAAQAQAGHVLLDGIARGRGFKGLVANRGQQALALAREFMPTAISLDVFLPDMLGWTVLARLKQDITTRHIPVLIVTMQNSSSAPRMYR